MERSHYKRDQVALDCVTRLATIGQPSGASFEGNHAMRNRLSTIAAALAIAACAVMYFDRPADGQQAAIPAGHFQFVVSEYRSNGKIFVFEPDSGRCWSRNSDYHVNDQWRDLGSPIIKQ
jgi:hypothetical protein